MKKLAVLMPTYNCEKYLQESIDSILNQTYSDFDFYIYDDCSTDNSQNLIQSYTDTRIIYIKSPKNLGIASTLNLGLENLLPNYEFIARMDADDWAFPNRFQKQIDFMEQNKSIMLCGTQGFWLKNMLENPLSGWEYPFQDNYIKLYLLFGASFGHSSIVLRSDLLRTNNLRYNETIKTCEDWDLWIKMSKIGEVVNLPDFLMKYRIVFNSNHRALENKKLHLKERSIIISKYWKDFNIKLSPEQVFEYYYETKESIRHDFYSKLNVLIDSFNELFLNHAQSLISKDQKQFSYMLARRTLDFWKRSGISRYNPIVWLILLNKIKFIDTFKLIRSQIN
jgi:glycosyltransferase involved in cell wall biosynthesis